MIIHSIVPYELIFANENTDEKQPEYISYHGAVLEVSPISGNQYKVNRIISARLGMFLDPQIQPGMVIEHESMI